MTNDGWCVVRRRSRRTTHTPHTLDTSVIPNEAKRSEGTAIRDAGNETKWNEKSALESWNL